MHEGTTIRRVQAPAAYWRAAGAFNVRSHKPRPKPRPSVRARMPDPSWLASKANVCHAASSSSHAVSDGLLLILRQRRTLGTRPDVKYGFPNMRCQRLGLKGIAHFKLRKTTKA